MATPSFPSGTLTPWEKAVQAFLVNLSTGDTAGVSASTFSASTASLAAQIALLRQQEANDVTALKSTASQFGVGWGATALSNSVLQGLTASTASFSTGPTVSSLTATTATFGSFKMGQDSSNAGIGLDFGTGTSRFTGFHYGGGVGWLGTQSLSSGAWGTGLSVGLGAWWLGMGSAGAEVGLTPVSQVVLDSGGARLLLTGLGGNTGGMELSVSRIFCDGAIRTGGNTEGFFWKGPLGQVAFNNYGYAWTGLGFSATYHTSIYAASAPSHLAADWDINGTLTQYGAFTASSSVTLSGTVSAVSTITTPLITSAGVTPVAGQVLRALTASTMSWGVDPTAVQGAGNGTASAVAVWTNTSTETSYAGLTWNNTTSTLSAANVTTTLATTSSVTATGVTTTSASIGGALYPTTQPAIGNLLAAATASTVTWNTFPTLYRSSQSASPVYVFDFDGFAVWSGAALSGSGAVGFPWLTPGGVPTPSSWGVSASTASAITANRVGIYGVAVGSVTAMSTGSVGWNVTQASMGYPATNVPTFSADFYFYTPSAIAAGDRLAFTLGLGYYNAGLFLDYDTGANSGNWRLLSGTGANGYAVVNTAIAPVASSWNHLVIQGVTGSTASMTLNGTSLGTIAYSSQGGGFTTLGGPAGSLFLSTSVNNALYYTLIDYASIVWTGTITR